jgi:hypothetical protein
MGDHMGILGAVVFFPLQSWLHLVKVPSVTLGRKTTFEQDTDVAHTIQ